MCGPESSRTTNVTSVPCFTVSLCLAKSIAVIATLFAPPPGVGRGVKLVGGVGVDARVMEQAVRLIVNMSDTVRKSKVASAREVFMRETIPEFYR